MNSKERVLRAINRKETDRIPMDITYTNAQTLDRLRKYLNVSDNIELFRYLGIDTYRIRPLEYVGEQRYFNGEKADCWGLLPEVYEGKYGDSGFLNPLKGISTVDEAENYRWPSIKDFDGSRLERMLEELSEFTIIGGVWAPIFHNVTWLCGLEDTFINLHLQPDVIETLIRHVTDFWVDYTIMTLEIAKGRIDIVENCNCFGGQNDMIISPELFRKFMKPALAKLYKAIKAYNVKIMQHSCGAIEPIIGDFIEIGADILNPVQVSAKGMDPYNLKNKYGNALTFCGGIDTQKILPSGTTDQVRQEVRRIAGILGKGGGYILAGSQGLENDIPEENILAMFDEGKKL